MSPHSVTALMESKCHDGVTLSRPTCRQCSNSSVNPDMEGPAGKP